MKADRKNRNVGRLLGRSLLLAAVIPLVLGCRRASPEPPTRPEAQAPAAPLGSQAADVAVPVAKSEASATPATAAFRRPGAARLVAVGDLHGDFVATQQVLRLAGALGPDGHWAGGELVLVQTGDQLDRGGGEKEILDLFEQLAKEAIAAGGSVVALNGNHETMNALGDFRYVTPDAVHDFDALEPDSKHAASVSGPMRERAAAFLPGGSMALRLAQRPVVAQVGDTVFVHGGLEPDHVRYGLDRLNSEVQAFLRGEGRPPAPMTDEDGPLWNRRYGSGSLASTTCGLLAQTLQAVGAKRLVIGHTIQEGGITSACQERVFRIDVGMSAHYGGNLVQALEIRGDAVKVLTAAKQ
jgi:hypothetical protein